MATKQIGPIQFQGKLGTIVGRSTRKGYMSLGIKAVSVTNPQTPKQVIQRVLFAGAQRFANTTPISAFAGFTRKAKTMRCSIRNVVTSIYGKSTKYGDVSSLPTGNDFFSITGAGAVGTTQIQNIDYTNFIFSDGSVNYAMDIPTYDNPSQVTLNLRSQADIVGTTNYIHHIIILCPDAKGWIVKTFTPKEETTIASIRVPDEWNGMKVHVWGYSQYPDENHTNVDYSQYDLMGSKAVRANIDSQSLFSRTQYMGSGNIG